MQLKLASRYSVIPCPLLCPHPALLLLSSPVQRDCDGVVTLWDTSTQQSVSDYEGHERRVWSVDFMGCPAGDMSTFASGSDDCTVKVGGRGRDWGSSDDCTVKVGAGGGSDDQLHRA